MTPEQKWDFNCGGICDGGEWGEVALLLGTRPDGAAERALAAAQLYREGRVKYIVPSGGVKWEYQGEMISEADFMTRILLREGVPQEAIIIENEARTTRENMIYGTLQINRKTKFHTVDKVIIVTTVSHMKRSLALAREWHLKHCRCGLKCEENVKLLDSAISLIKDLVDYRVVEDMEIDL